MSKIERYQGNVQAFASNAVGLERTVFGGTAQANDLTSQVTSAFLRGWGVVGPSEHPSLEDFNAAMYAMSQFIAYQHQMGVPEWNNTQEYYTGSVCTHVGVSYQSLDDENIGNEPPSAKWTPVLTVKSGGDAFQPKNEKLTAFSGLAGAANRLPYFTGANALALTVVSSVGRDILAAATKAAVLEYLGLGEAAKLPSPSVTTEGALTVKIPFFTAANTINYLVIQMLTITPGALSNGQVFSYSFPTAYDSSAWAILSGTVGIIAGSGADEGMEITNVTATGVTIVSHWNSRPASYAPVRLLTMGIKANA